MKTEVQDVIPVLPAGVYPAVFSKIEEAQNDQGSYWLWTFTARNGDVDVEITATTSPRVTVKTKAAKWLAGLGASIGIGDAIDFDDYLDTPCQIVVIINEAGYSRIDSVLPFPQAKPATVKAK